MGQVIRWLRRLRHWVRDRLGRPYFRRTAYVEELYEVPNVLDPATMYVAGTPGAPKWVVFACPCGRGHRVVLSLQRSHRTRWRLVVDRGTPTIWPSVDVVEARRCHYWIRRGRVRWVSPR